MAKWFTLAEVATLFDVSISTVKRWADTDKLETEAIPGGSLRRATAAGIRRFARNYGPAALEAFGGILAVGRFGRPTELSEVRVVSGLVEAGRVLQEQFPALVLVSFAEGGRLDIPHELRAAGFDGMVAAVVNDDEAKPAEEFTRHGWQMVCRESEDYWKAAGRLAGQASSWWRRPKLEAACA